MLRTILAVAVLTFATTAVAELADCAAATRVSGLWSTEIHGDGFYVYGEVHYRADGQSVGRGLHIANGEHQRIEFSGTWRVEGDVLIFSTETSSDTSWFPHPRTYRDRIETLTDEKLVLVAENGERSVRYRLDYSRLFPIDQARLQIQRKYSANSPKHGRANAVDVYVILVTSRHD